MGLRPSQQLSCRGHVADYCLACRSIAAHRLLAGGGVAAVECVRCGTTKPTFVSCYGEVAPTECTELDELVKRTAPDLRAELAPTLDAEAGLRSGTATPDQRLLLIQLPLITADQMLRRRHELPIGGWPAAQRTGLVVILLIAIGFVSFLSALLTGMLAGFERPDGGIAPMAIVPFATPAMVALAVWIGMYARSKRRFKMLVVLPAVRRMLAPVRPTVDEIIEAKTRLAAQRVPISLGAYEVHAAAHDMEGPSMKEAA